MKHDSRCVTTVLALVLLHAAAGCTTVQVRRVTSENESTVQGVRYYLPRPHILVKPSTEEEGGFKIDVVYLPDLEQAYAIDAESAMASHTLDVKLDNGVLKEISWIEDDSAVVAETAKTASGELAKAQFDQQKAEREKQEEEQKEQREEIEKAKQAIRDKELAIKVAEKELESLQAAASDPPTPDQAEAIRRKDFEIVKFKLELKALEKALARADEEKLNRAFNETDGRAGATTATAPADPPPSVWGPVLYVINDTYHRGRGAVTLEAVDWSIGDGVYQKRFRAAKVPVSKPSKPPGVPRLLTSGQHVVEFRQGKIPTLTAKMSAPVTYRSHTIKSEDGTPVDPLTMAVRFEESTLILDFVRALPLGAYDVAVSYIYKDSNTTIKNDKATIHVRVVTPQPSGPPYLTTIGEESVRNPDAGGPVLTRTFIGTVTGVGPATLKRVGGVVPPPPALRLDSGNALTIVFDGPLPRGQYTIQFDAFYDMNGTPASTPIEIRFRVTG